MNVRIHTLFIVKHLWYSCIGLWRVHFLFFKAVASFWGKSGDWGQVDITTMTTTLLVLLSTLLELLLCKCYQRLTQTLAHLKDFFSGSIQEVKRRNKNNTCFNFFKDNVNRYFWVISFYKSYKNDYHFSRPTVHFARATIHISRAIFHFS